MAPARLMTFEEAMATLPQGFVRSPEETARMHFDRAAAWETEVRRQWVEDAAFFGYKRPPWYRRWLSRLNDWLRGRG